MQKKPDNPGACSLRESSAERVSGWITTATTQKICWCIMWHSVSSKWRKEWMKGAYLARGPAQVGVPLWPTLYMAKVVCLCLHMCVCDGGREREVSAVEETGECTVQWRRLETGYSVCAKTEPVHLPPSPSPSPSLSLCEYNPFHSLRGRAANEPALSLPLSLHFPLVLYLSFAHEPLAELPSLCLHLAVDKPEMQRALLPLMTATTLSHLSPPSFSLRWGLYNATVFALVCVAVTPLCD